MSLIAKNTHCGRCKSTNIKRYNKLPRKARYTLREYFLAKDYSSKEAFCAYSCLNCGRSAIIAKSGRVIEK